MRTLFVASSALFAGVTVAASAGPLPAVDSSSRRSSIVRQIDQTTTLTKVTTINVGKLLDDMQQSASIAVVHYKHTTEKRRLTRGGVLFVKSVDIFRTKIIGLQKAIASKSSTELAKANRDAHAAFSRLTLSYRMLGLEDKQLAEVIRSITVSWGAYASYFLLPTPKSTVTSATLQKTKRALDKAFEQITRIETKTTKNKRVSRQLAYLKRRLSRYTADPLTPVTYRYALSDLVLVRSGYATLLDVVHIYYPDLVSDFDLESQFLQEDAGHWDDYYGAFYDAGMLQAYGADISVPADAQLDVSILEQSERDEASNDRAVASDVDQIEAVAPESTDVLPSDDGGAPLDEPSTSESAFDCAAEGCGETTAANPAADFSGLVAPDGNDAASEASPEKSPASEIQSEQDKDAVSDDGVNSPAAGSEVPSPNDDPANPQEDEQPATAQPSQPSGDETDSGQEGVEPQAEPPPQNDIAEPDPVPDSGDTGGDSGGGDTSGNEDN